MGITAQGSLLYVTWTYISLHTFFGFLTAYITAPVSSNGGKAQPDQYDLTIRESALLGLTWSVTWVKWLMAQILHLGLHTEAVKGLHWTLIFGFYTEKHMMEVRLKIWDSARQKGALLMRYEIKKGNGGSDLRNIWT